MRRSQIAVVSALAVVLIATLAWLVATRVVMSNLAGNGPSRTTSGNDVTRSIDLRDFAAVHTQGGWQLTITQGDDWRVELSYPEAMADNVTAEVRDGTLRLSYRAPRGFWLLGFGPPGRSQATIVAPALERLEMEGSANATIAGLTGDRLHVSAAGASSLEATGSRYQRLDLIVRGVGEVKFQGLAATDANVQLAGATEVTLTMAGGLLSGAMSGAHRLIYYGTVREENVTRAGAASIERRQ
jgi:hypothetical protein